MKKSTKSATKPSPGPPAAQRERRAAHDDAQAAAQRRKHDEACAVWKSLDASEQLRLAREASLTRADEFRLAYPDILSVGYGLKTTGRRGQTLTQEPCVAFFVKRKWTAAEAKKHRVQPNRIPHYLYAYCTIAEERKLCAIPTDVEGLQNYVKVKPQINAKVRVTSPNVIGVKGVFCCAVQYNGSGPVYGLGCHHVLAMSEQVADIPSRGVSVRSNDSADEEIGSLSNFYGIVNPDRVFFDAALANTTNGRLFAQVVDEPAVGTLVVKSEEGLSSSFRIHTSRGIVEAQFVKVWRLAENLVPYVPLNLKYGSIKTMHAVEVRATSGQTIGGDSGSAVFNSSDGIFQGMHIAGGRERAFFIPAYELFRASNYGLTSGEEMLTLAFPPF